MFALASEADIQRQYSEVRFVPISDITWAVKFATVSPEYRGGRHENSPPSISASGRQYYRLARAAQERDREVLADHQGCEHQERVTPQCAR
jgi:hypothetical protein